MSNVSLPEPVLVWQNPSDRPLCDRQEAARSSRPPVDRVSRPARGDQSQFRKLGVNRQYVVCFRTQLQSLFSL